MTRLPGLEKDAYTRASIDSTAEFIHSQFQSNRKKVRNANKLNITAPVI